MVWEQILSGAIGGAAFGVSGWVKNRKNDKASFSFGRLAPIVITSALIGGVAGYIGQDYDIVSTGSIGVAVGTIITNIWKAIIA